MARKFKGKLMVAMIDLLSLILVEVQANDLGPTSSHPSLSDPLPIPFDLDNVEGVVLPCREKMDARCNKKTQK